MRKEASFNDFWKWAQTSTSWKTSRKDINQINRNRNFQYNSTISFSRNPRSMNIMPTLQGPGEKALVLQKIIMRNNAKICKKKRTVNFIRAEENTFSDKIENLMKIYTRKREKPGKMRWAENVEKYGLQPPPLRDWDPLLPLRDRSPA